MKKARLAFAAAPLDVSPDAMFGSHRRLQSVGEENTCRPFTWRFAGGRAVEIIVLDATLRSACEIPDPLSASGKCRPDQFLPQTMEDGEIRRQLVEWAPIQDSSGHRHLPR
jgi:hypothetical protein